MEVRKIQKYIPPPPQVEEGQPDKKGKFNMWKTEWGRIERGNFVCQNTY